ncbi:MULTISPECIES: AbrB/MazE/SpoVT family DNA-binding domain-containing protein [Cuniculiplasmataceae]|uniref:AbrB/MazE/SpoVT family DNA-binding domain-containing protein n=1 Tax=Cuniculiplasma sp. SKW4 TaxID=3400171 RepID=UPI003FCFA6D5
MSWKSHVRRISGSLYVTLPKDYLRAKGIEQDDVAIFELQKKGLLIRFRKPVSPSEEEEA